MSFTQEQLDLIDFFGPYEFPNGLYIEFPTEDSWLVTYKDRADSGRMDMPPLDILNAVQKVARRP